ncbi:MAG: hypothetical protein WAV50_01865 [Minisyncoccia bacterium]
MVAARYAYSKGRTLARRVSGVFAIAFGLFAVLFTVAPKLWSWRSPVSNQLFSFGEILTQNVAFADTPHTDGYDGGADSSSDAGCSCAADSIGDAVGGGIGDSNGDGNA